MAFNVLFMAHSPDANPELHQSKIDTGKFKLWTVVVRNQEEALQFAKGMVEEHQIDSILLCPGFTHLDVAELFSALEGKVGISVARGDGLSSLITAKARAQAYGGN